jgi:uncharacterized membrane protein YoaK (UPF0700 family)
MATTSRSTTLGAAPRARRLSPAAIRDLLLVGLTFSSGAIDAISFLALGKVFTAFMTGNVVFLGLGVAGAGGPDEVRVLIAIAAFAAGVFVATRIVATAKGSGLWPRRVSVALGVVMVLQAVFLALWVATSGRPGTGSGHVLTGLMALAMGTQSGAVMALAVEGVFTTAATATVMFLMRDAAAPGGSGDVERGRLAAVLAALFAGATAGGLLLAHARAYAPILPLAATAAVVATASVALVRHHGGPGDRVARSPEHHR